MTVVSLGTEPQSAFLAFQDSGKNGHTILSRLLTNFTGGVVRVVASMVLAAGRSMALRLLSAVQPIAETPRSMFLKQLVIQSIITEVSLLVAQQQQIMIPCQYIGETHSFAGRQSTPKS